MRTVKIELTPEEAKFIENQVITMSGHSMYDRGNNENDTEEVLKDRTALTEEDEDMLNDLHESLHEFIVDEIYDIREKEGNSDRSIRMLEIWYNLVEGSLIENNNTFHVDISFEYDILLER